MNTTPTKGVANILLIFLAIFGIIIYLLVTQSFPFNDKLFNYLYPKTSSFAIDIQPVGQTNGWLLTFADEFDGTSLDLSKWRPNWLGSTDTTITKPINSAETSCYDPAQVRVTNGELDLTAIKSSCSVNGLNYNYRSGIIESNGKFNFTYGYMEARIWTPAGVGVWPAFWSDGQNWPTDGEIDVVEAYGTDESSYHYHYAGCGGDCGPGGNIIVPGATTSWHIYAADWEPGIIKWYYDGKLVWQYTTSITSSPQYLILNLGLNSNQASVPSTMKVDYVRFWKKDPNTVPTTTTLIPLNDTWKYLDNGTDQGTTWRGVSFDDSFWKSGPAQLGYGDGDEATIVSYGPDANNKYITTYFRNSFNIIDTASIKSLTLNMLRDDGAVVYLNGTEVFRTNMLTGSITYKTLAYDAADDGNQIFTAIINPNLLVAGKNTLAIEAHQSSGSSSDLTMQLELVGNLETAPAPTPTLSPSPTSPALDTILPTVTITKPLNGSIVPRNKSFTVSADASDNVGVTKVEFYIDGRLKCTSITAPYDCNTKISDKVGATHTISAKAYDLANNYSSSSISVATR